MRRILGALLVGLTTIFGFGKWIVDWTGRSTFFDDFKGYPLAWGSALLEFLQRQNDLWFYGTCAVLAIVGLVLLFAPNIGNKRENIFCLLNNYTFLYKSPSC